MIVTFPHLGPVYLIAKLMLKDMGIAAVIPAVNGPEVLAKGKALAPEEMCLPFKFMIGNLMEAYESGARKVIMPATIGPCRLGEYGELLKQIMDKNGYEFQWILLDTPKAIGAQAFFNRVKEVSIEKNVSNAQSLNILRKSVKLMKQFDQTEAKVKELAGYAQNPKECVAIYRNMRKRLEAANSLNEGFLIVKDAQRQIVLLPTDKERSPICINVTGEIYTLIESAANQNLEEKLMLAGCSVKRRVTVSWWISHTVNGIGSIAQKKAGQKYLPYEIGGFAKETVEEIIGSPKNHCNGVIKVMPSGCMPEIVAKAACDRISQEKGIRILNLVFDEMTGSAGYETRLEAFIDMLERRQNVFLGN